MKGPGGARTRTRTRFSFFFFLNLFYLAHSANHITRYTDIKISPHSSNKASGVSKPRLSRTVFFLFFVFISERVGRVVKKVGWQVL